jgi:CHAD domain-containing protein
MREFPEHHELYSIVDRASDTSDPALRAAGRTPGDYTSKFRLELRPELPSTEAMRLILLSLLRTTMRNVDGILENIDIECIHDFRVAIRRIRSAVGQIKGVFPDTLTAELKRDFKALGRLTSRNRDLDVFLAREHYYRSLIPEQLRSHLDSLFKDLRDEREREHRRLVAVLRSPSFSEVIDRWEMFLSKLLVVETETRSAGIPVFQVARKTIWNRYRSVAEFIREIDDETPDRKLHRLRIGCKKLRYLLELFASLFPPREIKKLVSELKRLQNNLGDFNDLTVQQESLAGYLQGLRPQEDAESVGAAAAARELLACLQKRQLEVRAEFQQTFRRFSRKENVLCFRALFGGEP